MRIPIASLCLLQVVLAGCLSADPGEDEECYPVIQVPGREPNDIPEQETITDLTTPARWTWRASKDCGTTYWRMERGDGQVEWKTGLEVDFEPREVAFYNLSLVLEQEGVFVVKHPIGLQVNEDHSRDTRHVFPSGIDDITIEVQVACCAFALASSVVLNPPTAPAPGDWLIVRDAAGATIASGEMAVRRGAGDGNWAAKATYGTWTFNVVRSDPFSPYFNRAFELVTGIAVDYVGIYEPGDVVSPPPRPEA